MKNLTILERDGVFVADSREVAETIGKEHKHLLRDIDRYISVFEKAASSILNIPNPTSPKLDSLNFFIPDSYRDSKGEIRRKYNITRKGCDMIANKMTGEKGVLFTAAYVTKFEEMERATQTYQKQLPKNYKEALLALVSQIEENEKIESEKRVLERLVVENAPKISYLEKILQSTGTLAITQIAKDYGMTGQQLNKILHEEGLQYKVNGQWVLRSKYQNQGLTKSNTFLFEKADGEMGSTVATRWTQNGRILIHQILEKRGIVAESDQQNHSLQTKERSN
ncbi:phage regulatory protein/antirepressor Ant [Sulfoacidibacillus thermotolerans]|uniref:Antirepressor protein C-terminal domain-containing protein n=1 Tax=Sulfoacidibacillus thermotolerans TaxID=1765684 RepID=A0A2U3CU87_SULT2|nr:phage regulatory protein/antirepressor Ant [Sulfoacidibacillus thermotolerans]PWI52582.1 hypothetical protein BM613_14065 [Sulfoacidibacillus thermotolerans]